MSNTIKNLEKIIDFCDEMQIATEAKVTQNTINKEVNRLMGHLAKFKFKTKDCTGNWINSIIGAYCSLHAAKSSLINKYIDDDDFADKEYFKGLKKHACAKETGYKISDFPKSRPSDWTLTNLMDETFLRNELTQYIMNCDMIDIHKKHEMVDLVNNQFDKNIKMR